MGSHYFFPPASAIRFSSAVSERSVTCVGFQGWASQNALSRYTPFFCFSRMIAAASSLVFWYWVPVWVFLFFCEMGQSYERESRGIWETNRITGLLQGLGPIVITLITPSHIGDDWAMNGKDKGGMGAKLSEKKSWRGRASSARKAANHSRGLPFSSILLFTRLLCTLDLSIDACRSFLSCRHSAESRAATV
jgi:hypothetical protein